MKAGAKLSDCEANNLRSYLASVNVSVSKFAEEMRVPRYAVVNMMGEHRPGTNPFYVRRVQRKLTQIARDYDCANGGPVPRNAVERRDGAEEDRNRNHQG